MKSNIIMALIKVFWKPKDAYQSVLNNPIHWGIIIVLSVLWGISRIGLNSIYNETLRGLLYYEPETVALEFALVFWLMTKLFTWFLNKMKIEINHQRVASIVIISYIPEISISYILWIFANYFGDFIAYGYIIGIIWSIILLVYGIKIVTNKEVLPSIGYYIVFQISVFLTTGLVAPIFNAIYYGNKLYK